MTNVLIHCHPQMAYLARVLTDIVQNDRTRNLTLIAEGSFMKKMNYHFIDFFHKTSLLSGYFKADYPQLPEPDLSFQIPENVTHILNDSALDTIFRDLTPGFSVKSYYLGSDSCQIGIINSFRESTCLLTSRYIQLLRQIKPSHIYMSHSQYHHYIALYAASVICNIPISIFHSGFFWTYRVHSQRFSSISPTIGISEFIDTSFPESSLQYLSKSHIFKPKRAKHISVNSLCTQISEYLHSSDIVSAKSDSPCFIVCLPCIKELSTWYPVKPPIFKGRYDFVKYTLNNIIDSAHMPVAIKTHPMSWEYHETEIIDSLITEANSRRINKFFVIDGTYSCIPFLKRYKPRKEDLYIITTDGSISLEMAQYGIKTICTSASFGPIHSFHLPSSLKEYKQIISGKQLISNSTTPSTTKLSTLYQSIYNMGILKNNSQYGKFLKENFEPIYHFGESKTIISPNKFTELIMIASNRYTAKELVSTSQTHLIYP